jgi:gluconolactonase
MHPSIKIFDDAIRQVISTDFVVETLASDCLFTEGPVWHREGYYLFSDIAANAVYKLIPGHEKKLFIAQSGTRDPADEDLKPDQAGSNGLAWDATGSLLVCRHGSHMIARWNGHTLEPIITHYQQKPLNSPNDIIIDNEGRVFFSDPPYGLKDGSLNPEKFQPAGGVYFGL